MLGYSFITKGKVGRGEAFLCLSWVDVMLPSSAPPPGWAGEFSCPCMVKLGPHIIVSHVCREYVVGSINLLSSLGRMWVSCLHCFSVLGYLPCFCFMGLLPSKPAWFCGWANLLPWVIINLQGSPIYIFYIQPPSGITYLIIYFVPLLCPYQYHTLV